jgi:very-short-patch-repair endonuclease
MVPGQLITAVDMAIASGIDPKRFRAALRAADLGWHPHNSRWEVMRGSCQHEDMEMIMARLCGDGSKLRSATRAVRDEPKAAMRDEHYVLDLCDEFLGLKASRQHCFSFLSGDPNLRGYRKPLPVDGFYPDLKLVVEYHERQHRERVSFFDNKATVSGMSRGEQRRRYDERRRDLLPKHGYALVVLEVDEFAHNMAKRLLRNSQDKDIVGRRLREFGRQARSGAIYLTINVS